MSLERSTQMPMHIMIIVTNTIITAAIIIIIY